MIAVDKPSLFFWQKNTRRLSKSNGQQTTEYYFLSATYALLFFKQKPLH
ncbi:hypothetical protein PEPS_08070 [Persicobacter psychrovividus]|uniref:Uncharacterized protein n=1 Tax=Persicobacter psychrovividus TaxID=387638 RepID=A0ABM7VC66_9BACT|nr:hypothetical protein PEPS_08070 [Persicobacter psychrovividus]